LRLTKQTSIKIAGIDEAGRGPIIGPLIIAGVSMDKKDLPKLFTLGVKDSKLLSPKKREKLAEEIKKCQIQYHIERLSPKEIDLVVDAKKKLHRLNWFEAKTMAKAIAALKPDLAYVDASDVLADRFKNQITEYLSFRVLIVSEHKADVKYPIVSAASIIAKVERDRSISDLREEFGNFGSGYASDHRTIEFLKNWIREFGEYPDFVRKSWKPTKKIMLDAKTAPKNLV